MRREIESVLLGLILCGLLSGCGQSIKRASQDDVKAIREREDEFLAVHEFNDGAKLAEFYTDDALLIPPNEPIVRGKQAIAEWYQREFEKAPPIENPTVVLDDVEVSGNIAFIRGTFTLKYKDDGGTRIENLRFLSVWRRRPDDSWGFYCDIWNTHAPPSLTQ